MDTNAKIFVAGHRGLVGSALMRQLAEQNYTNIVVRTRQELDLTNQLQVEKFFDKERPDYVFLAAARVGGINANAREPADFIRENLQIQTNVIDSAYNHGCKKFMFLGSACIYPKITPQPIREDYFMTAPLEPTNDGYAIAKVAGLMMCQKYTQQYGWPTISVMPNNLYGIYDNFNPQHCHVIPAFVRRFIEAVENQSPTVTCLGDGSPTREFIYSDDLAQALIFLMNTYNSSEIINIGTGYDITIKVLAETIADIVGYKGEIIWDTTAPNGTPRRQLCTSKLDQLGFKLETSLQQGLATVIKWYMENRDSYDRT
jgi:GDP-L-fucose synthase